MKSILTLAACLSVILPAWAGAADLTGTWRLDLTRSDLGAGHGNADFVITKVIEQRGDTITQTERYENGLMFGRPVGDAQWQGNWTADGVPRASKAAPMFPGMPASDSKTTVSWQGNNLVITSRGANSRQGAWFSQRRYYLSEDGNQLTEVVQMSAVLADLEQKLVFVRSSATGQAGR